MDSGWLGEGGLFGRAGALFTVASAGKGAIYGKGMRDIIRLGKKGGDVGCNSGGGEGVFSVGLWRVRGADDQPSLSRFFLWTRVVSG